MIILQKDTSEIQDIGNFPTQHCKSSIQHLVIFSDSPTNAASVLLIISIIYKDSFSVKLCIISNLFCFSQSYITSPHYIVPRNSQFQGIHNLYKNMDYYRNTPYQSELVFSKHCNFSIPSIRFVQQNLPILRFGRLFTVS